MFDSTLRPIKDRILSPAAAVLGVRVHPTTMSALGLILTLSAALAASQELVAVAVVCFLAGRTADGVDGLIARRTDRASDVGGLIDFVFDSVGYAAIPLGVALGVDDRAVWIATAVLVASFYVNAVSLGYIAALFEKRGLGQTQRRNATSAVLPRGLVEGFETIVFFVAALALPTAASTIWWVMSGAVAITVIERVRWAIGELR